MLVWLGKRVERLLGVGAAPKPPIPVPWWGHWVSASSWLWEEPHRARGAVRAPREGTEGPGVSAVAPGARHG